MSPRSEAIRRAANASYQICVIGGGATGAGCALDAQLRGLKTLLVEAGGFASATSRAATKLGHGALCYLEQAVTRLDAGQFGLVRRALRERKLMLRNAPNLAQIRHFIVPCFNLFDAAYYDIGLKFYDWLSGEA